MLMTPVTAFTPHIDPPGPRITSILAMSERGRSSVSQKTPEKVGEYTDRPSTITRSEEHTSELQSRSDLVCRLLLEKKNSSALMKLTAHDSLPCSSATYRHT